MPPLPSGRTTRYGPSVPTSFGPAGGPNATPWRGPASDDSAEVSSAPGAPEGAWVGSGDWSARWPGLGLVGLVMARLPNGSVSRHFRRPTAGCQAISAEYTGSSDNA